MKFQASNFTPEIDISIPKKGIGLVAKIKNGVFNIGKVLIKRNTFVEIICAFLIVLFVYTGFNKLMDIEKFKSEIQRSPFIENWSSIIAYVVPIGELLLAIGLVIKNTRLLSLYVSLSVMALFTGYVWLMLNFAYDLPCSCGGIISKLTWHEHLFLNAAFTILTIVAILMNQKRKIDKLVF